MGFSAETLRRWALDNCGPPSLLVGKRRYFKRAMIDSWLKARAVCS